VDETITDDDTEYTMPRRRQLYGRYDFVFADPTVTEIERSSVGVPVTVFQLRIGDAAPKFVSNSAVSFGRRKRETSRAANRPSFTSLGFGRAAFTVLGF